MKGAAAFQWTGPSVIFGGGTGQSICFFLPVYIVAWLVGGSDSTLSAGRGFRQQEKDEAVQQCIIWRAPALVRRDDIQYTRIKQYCFF